ncbi:MAG TPA: ferritin-like domain-containing protein [Candidatus Fournierella merdavium]|nr:ferritin-like domain-containing protein [Candidatus Fournierella merdavium]
MAMTKKEQSLLKDLQNEEKLCAEKYQKAAEAACDPALKTMLGQIAQAEQNHYDTVTQMLAGKGPEPQTTQPKAAKQQPAPGQSAANRAGKKKDAYLVADLLATEKYVSAAYNTSVFEFCDEKSRQVLSGIQQQEQHHGKQLFDYMQVNGMYR